VTPDVKGLPPGAGRAEPAPLAGRHLGRRTADSPFAVLLASTAARAERGAPDAPATASPALDLATLATQGKAQARPAAAPDRPRATRPAAKGTEQEARSRQAPLQEAGTRRPAARGRVDAIPSSPAPAPAALVELFGTPATGLEGAAAHRDASEEAQEATERSLPTAPAPVSARPGADVILPPPQLQRPAAADPAHPAPRASRGTPTTHRQARPLHHRAAMGVAASADRRIQPGVGPEHASVAAPSAPTVTASSAEPPHRAPGEASAPTAPPTSTSASTTTLVSGAGPAVAFDSATPPSATAGTVAAEAPAEPAWRAASRQGAPEATPGAPHLAEPPPAEATPQQAARRDDRRASRAEPAQPRPGATPRPAGARPEAPAGLPRATPPAPQAAVTAQVVARELGTSARLTQASRAGQSLREPALQKGARTAHPAEATPPPQALAQPALPPPEPAGRPAAVPRGAPLQPPELPQTLLGGAILPHTAHLRLESESLGDLALHLRVRDGVAHLRVEGEQAGRLAGRSHELQQALAAEGLALGQLELERPAVPAAPAGQPPRSAADQGTPQGERERPERDEPTPGQHTGAAPARRPSGRATAHHVEA
jgi:flagellar hook-length control protein FliK